MDRTHRSRPGPQGGALLRARGAGRRPTRRWAQAHARRRRRAPRARILDLRGPLSVVRGAQGAETAATAATLDPSGVKPGTILAFGRSTVAELLDVDASIEVVERAFELQGLGVAPLPSALGIPADGGWFHVKAGLLGLERPYFAAKVNANFPGNTARRRLPTIQGVIVLMDGETGTPLALLDSGEVTARRTAAATAVAARRLARPDARSVMICGCGAQATAQLTALARVLPLERGFAYNLDSASADRFAAAS